MLGHLVLAFHKQLLCTVISAKSKQRSGEKIEYCSFYKPKYIITLFIFSLFDANVVQNVFSQVKFKGNVDSRDSLSPLGSLPLKKWSV